MTQTFKYQLVSKDIMNTQINVRLPRDLVKKARGYSKKHGYANIQEFIRHTIRERLFDEPVISQKELKLVLKLADAVKKDKSLLGTHEELMTALQR